MSNLAVIALNAQAYIADLPQTFEESQNRPDRDYWLKAIEIELKAHEANKTWTLVDTQKVQFCRWIFRIKRNENGMIERYKARLVAKG
ncbi:hypothetical protein QE152_g253 [Popillia japonica]|uniref:Polyprotein n=1 Tax=Popillia japonica TaxID=7064 RepID=A0AAW1NJT7_POPJA